jgi:hypothetical protein
MENNIEDIKRQKLMNLGLISKYYKPAIRGAMTPHHVSDRPSASSLVERFNPAAREAGQYLRKHLPVPQSERMTKKARENIEYMKGLEAGNWDEVESFHPMGLAL